MPNWTTNNLIGFTKEMYEKYKSEERAFDFEKFFPMPEELKRTIAGGRIDECIAYYLLKNNTKDAFFAKVNKERLRCPVSPQKTKKAMFEELLQSIGDNPVMYNDEEHFEERTDANGRKATYRINENYGHTPEEIGEWYYNLHEKYGVINWYDWSCAHWGVKWNTCNVHFDAESNKLHFDTPWGMPTPIFEKLCADYPDAPLEFICDYEDGFTVEASNHNGEFIIDKEYEWEREEEDDEEEEQEEEQKQQELPDSIKQYFHDTKLKARSMEQLHDYIVIVRESRITTISIGGMNFLLSIWSG